MEFGPGLLAIAGFTVFAAAIIISVVTRILVLGGKSGERIQALMERDYFAERIVSRWLRYDVVLALAGALWVTLAAVWQWST